MKRHFYTALFLLLLSTISKAQPCTPAGDETTYGTSDTWIGYVYNNINFTSYAGLVTQGSTGNPAFDQNFGGSNVSYTTNGCPVTTETFSVRYKLTKTFADNDYELTVGGDDGYRLSIDGGVTWLINKWGDQSYTVTSPVIHLNGTYNLVLEYYENGGDNRVSFNIQATCLGVENQTIYGTANTWRGYVYDGTNFNIFKGVVTKGNSSSPDFDESFGGDNVVYTTSSCATPTETFSVRYRLRKSFPNGTYLFTVGGDDGYRLSLDGGATWVINKWNDQSYTVTTYSAILSGLKDIVLEYYENGGQNRVSFSLGGTVLPVYLVDFTAKSKTKQCIVAMDCYRKQHAGAL